jgi:hypothetical protein
MQNDFKTDSDQPGSLQPDCSAATWSVKPLFAWYDLWVGIFWDSRKRKLYILPLPCVGVVIEFPKPPNSVLCGNRGEKGGGNDSDKTT